MELMYRELNQECDLEKERNGQGLLPALFIHISCDKWDLAMPADFRFRRLFSSGTCLCIGGGAVWVGWIK